MTESSRICNSSLFRNFPPAQDIILAFGDIAMTVNHTILLEKTITPYSDHLFLFLLLLFFFSFFRWRNITFRFAYFGVNYIAIGICLFFLLLFSRHFL